VREHAAMPEDPFPGKHGFSLDHGREPAKRKRRKFVRIKNVLQRRDHTRECERVVGTNNPLCFCAHPRCGLPHVLVAALHRAEMDRSQLQDPTVIPMVEQTDGALHGFGGLRLEVEPRIHSTVGGSLSGFGAPQLSQVMVTIARLLEGYFMRCVQREGGAAADSLSEQTFQCGD